ncbi:MAG TPA: hypothetical protein V6C71_20515 [Coleofasciculaceae cyanobacterium]
MSASSWFLITAHNRQMHDSTTKTISLLLTGTEAISTQGVLVAGVKDQYRRLNQNSKSSINKAFQII